MSSPPPPDPYKILGVSKDAPLATIRSAHRKLVLTCHPDKCQDEALKAQKADEFHKVQQAYELLSDEQRRAKHDDKARLAELKAEILRESGNARRAAGAYDHGGPTTPRTGTTYNMRREREREHVVEIRPPKSRYYGEEPPPQPPRPSPRFDQDDYRPKRYEDAYDMPPSSSSSRKAGGSRSYREEPRHEDNKSRIQRKWKDVAAKATSQDKFREYEDRRRSRDKDRRQDHQSKHYYSSPRVDSESETESDVEEFMAPPRRSAESKRRYAEPPKRSKKEEDTRRRRSDESDSSEDHDHKTNHNFQSAAEYILKTRVKASSERDERHRPTMTRAASNKPVTPPTVPPPPASVASVDSSAKRSSARRGAVSSSKSSPKDRKMPEIVEAAPTPSRRAEVENTRFRPNLASSATSPSAAKGSGPSISNITRAATMEAQGLEKQPGMRRSQTSPIHTVTSPPGHVPYKSSKLRPAESHDSGYSSPGTPETPVPPNKNYKTSQYRIVTPSEHDSDDSDDSTPTIVPIDPETSRHRATSPRTQSQRYEQRPTVDHRASPRNTPTRAATWGDERSPPPSRAPLNRAATSREEGSGSRRLYGEISSPEGRSGDVRSPPAGYSVRYGHKYGEEDVIYGDYQSQRGRGDSRAKDRDAYAYQRGGRGAQSPGLGERPNSRRMEVPTH